MKDNAFSVVSVLFLNMELVPEDVELINCISIEFVFVTLDLLEKETTV